MELEQLIAFCILMENGQGIVGKAPSYIFEKYEACSRTTKREWLRGMLDLHNQAKFDEYIKTWRVDK
jgi:hypothetical protein